MLRQRVASLLPRGTRMYATGVGLEPDSVSRVSSYKVSVGDVVVQVKTFQEVQAVVMEALTSLLAQDPEAVAKGAMMANRAFSVGTVQHVLDTHGSWRTRVTVHGEPGPRWSSSKNLRDEGFQILASRPARPQAICDHETAATAAKTHGHRVKGGPAGRRMRSTIADPPSRLACSIGQTCSCSSRS